MGAHKREVRNDFKVGSVCTYSSCLEKSDPCAVNAVQKFSEIYNKFSSQILHYIYSNSLKFTLKASQIFPST